MTMLSQRASTPTLATSRSSTTVSASGISPQNDYVSSLVIGSGHVFRDGRWRSAAVSDHAAL